MDKVLLEMIGRQHGVIARKQLREQFGWSDSRFCRATRRGTFVGVTPSVLRLASTSDTFPMRKMVLQLHLDEQCFLNSTTAARLYGLRSMPTSPVRATVPEAIRRACPSWAEPARSSWFDAADFTRRDDGLIVATPLRMLFGLAATLQPFRFARAAEDAWNLQLITPEQAADYLQRHRCRGKNGVTTMERWLDGALAQNSPAQSGLEQWVHPVAPRSGPRSSMR